MLEQVTFIFVPFSNNRAEADLRNETLGKKIMEARNEKIPYLLVVGDKEVEQGTVSVDRRTDGNLGSMKVEDFIKRVQDEVASFRLD